MLKLEEIENRELLQAKVERRYTSYKSITPLSSSSKSRYNLTSLSRY